MSIYKTFSFPTELWERFEAFLTNHPEMNVSGWFQKQIKLMLDRSTLIECDYFKEGYCQTDSTINECTLLKYGKCNLRG